MPEVIDLIAELCLIAQNQKAMCKALRDEELLLIFSGQRNAIPLAIGFRITSEVNRDIKHSATYSAHQLALRILLLEVQSAQHALCGHRLIVLHKVDIDASFLHIFFVVGFHEISTSITMNSRLNNTESLDAAYIFLNFNLSHFFYLLLLLDFFQITAQRILPGWKRSEAHLHQLALTINLNVSNDSYQSSP